MTEGPEKVDINRASEEALTALPGIGAALAKRIVEYRETVHPFEEVIELTAVPGISERMVRIIEDGIAVGPDAPVDEIEQGEGQSRPPIADTAQEEEEPAETFSLAAPDREEASPEQAPEMEPDREREREDVEEGEAGEPVSPVQQGDQLMEPDSLEAEVPVGMGLLDDAPPPPSMADAVPERATSPESISRAEGAAPTAALAAEMEQKARRRGCIVLVLGGLLGAILGSILTLGLLAVINRGTLSFSDADARLERNFEDTRQAQDELLGKLEAMDAQWQLLATRTGEMSEQQQQLDDSFASVEQTIGRYEQDIQALETTTHDIGERLDSVAAAAQNFDTFLDSMRDLLFELRGPPPTEEPVTEPAGSASPVSTAEPESTATMTPTGLPTRAGSPTRTPRPTATPFTLPTSTPEPQP